MKRFLREFSTAHGRGRGGVYMSKVFQLPTSPPVNIKIWEKSRKYFWQYDYLGCTKYGPFRSQSQALDDANRHSRQI